jgi:hypothetical protein
VISGVMPKFYQAMHFFGCGVMCLFFTGLFVLAGTVFVAAFTGAGPDSTAYVVVSIPFAGFAAYAVVSLLRSLNTLVREFSYDGRQFRFRTIAHADEYIRELADIAEVRQGQSPRGSGCFVLSFRNGQKVYLDFSLPNVAVLAELLRYDAERLPK